MPQSNNNQLIGRFQEFRQKLYNCFGARRDSIMDLLDALAGNIGANSIAELSLSPLFARTYNSLYKAIKESFDTPIPPAHKQAEEEEEEKQQELIRVIAQLVDQPQQRNFYLFVMDTTPHPRPYAKTLIERGYIYQPNTIKGNKPVNIGHSYSILSILPEKGDTETAPWSVPLSGERVPINKSSLDVGGEQIQSVMCDSSLPWHEKLCVLVGDTTEFSQTPRKFNRSGDWSNSTKTV